MKGSEAWARAHRLQVRAAELGFDWPSLQGVCDKLAEEAAELAAVAEGDEQRLFEEWGDILLTVVNLGRHLGLDPDAALAAAINRFESRFARIEAAASQLPPLGDRRRLEAMEALWLAAKAAEPAVGGGRADA